MSRSTNYWGRGAWCAIAPRSRRWNRRWRDEAARADGRPPTDGPGPAGVRWNGERQAERSRSAPPLGPPTDGSGLAGVRWNGERQAERSRSAPPLGPATDDSGLAGVRWNGERQAERSRSAPPLGPPTDDSGLAGPSTMTRAAREILIRPLMTEKSLLEPTRRTSARNTYGRITVRHRGGGAKRMLRTVDFRREKFGVPARVAAIEYDPNRSARLALLHYRDGEKRYIIAPLALKVGDTVMSGPQADILPGNALPLRNIPVGTLVHNVEPQPGRGAQMCRSAG